MTTFSVSSANKQYVLNSSFAKASNNKKKPSDPRKVRIKLRNVSSDDGNANETVTRKYNFILFVLLRNYFNSSELLQKQ